MLGSYQAAPLSVDVRHTRGRFSAGAIEGGRILGSGFYIWPSSTGVEARCQGRSEAERVEDPEP